MTALPNNVERRLSRRYELGLVLHYRVFDGRTMSNWRTGWTCNISTAGVKFRCSQPLHNDTLLEIVIDWPSTHDNLYPIFLQTAGQVLRNHDECVAVRIAGYRIVIEKAATPLVNAASIG